MTDKREHTAAQQVSTSISDVTSTNSPQALRQQAEALLLAKAASKLENIESLSPAQTRQMLHELQVHQIELEMQNEELRDAQVALGFERARYFDLYDLAPIGYCTLSEQGLIMQANLTVASLLGSARIELLNQRWTRFIYKEDADLYYLHRKKLVESGEPQSCELRMMKKDGTQFWGQWAATVSPTAGGELELRTVLSDITERKRTELATARLAAIVDSSDDAVYSEDLRGIAVSWNRGAEKIFCYPAAEMIGKSVALLIPSERQEEVTEILGKIVRGESVHYFDTVRRQKDGNTIDVDITISPIKDKTGRIVGASTVARDNTERKLAESARRATDRYYRALADASTEIPYRMSADWSTLLPLDGRDLFASSGSPLADWAWVDHHLPSDEHARVRQTVSEAIADKKLFEMEHRVLRPDGSTAWVRSRAVPILDDNGGLVEWFGSASDITERKRIEQELIKTTAVADKANRAKSEFLSSMSHELRTPLNAILGFAQLLESVIPPLAATQKRNVEHILKAGWYLLALVDEILDLALIESGTLSLSMDAVSLDEVMRECQVMLDQQARTRGIRMSFPRFEVPCYINADRKRVKQVLSNLLSNAIKYNTPDGAVDVELVLNTTGRIRISVSDTGDGLSADRLAQLFQPFNRLGKEKGTEQGTGIGLVVSKRVVEMMGGTIGVQSTVGKGSVFWVEFDLTIYPSPVVAAVQTASVADAALATGPIEAPLRTLLYVEDNQANLALVEAILSRRSDIRLLTATNVERGVEIARTVLPDVILMDINLPGISGIEAMKILAGDSATARIPVVALSANAIASDIEYGLKTGFFRYLTKPIKINEFMDTLDVALEFSLSTANSKSKEEQL